MMGVTCINSIFYPPHLHDPRIPLLLLFIISSIKISLFPAFLVSLNFYCFVWLMCYPNFYLPFSGYLDPDNRRIAPARLIPWELAEEIYLESLCDDFGAPTLPARVAFGSLPINRPREFTACARNMHPAHTRHSPATTSPTGRRPTKSASPMYALAG